MASADADILIALLIVLTLYVLMFAHLLECTTRMQRAEGWIAAGTALCLTILLLSAWNIASMVPSRTSASAAAALIACAECTVQWQRRRALGETTALSHSRSASPQGEAADERRFVPAS
jgi:hypothetical protein